VLDSAVFYAKHAPHIRATDKTAYYEPATFFFKIGRWENKIQLKDKKKY